MDVLLDAVRFFWFQFLTGLCTHLPLPLVLILILALLMGRVGRSLGIPYQVWHEHAFKQFTAAIALTLLLCKVLLVGFLLEAGRTKPFPLENVYHGKAPAYVAGVLLSLAVVVGCFFLLERFLRRFGPEPEARTTPRPNNGPSTWPLVLGVLLVAGVFVFFLLRPIEWEGFQFLTDVGQVVSNRTTDLVNSSFLLRDWLYPTQEHYIHGLVFATTVLLTFFYAVVYFARNCFSAAVPLFFVLNVAVAVYGFLCFYFPPFQAICLLLIAAVVLIGGAIGYPKTFPGLEPLYAQDKLVRLESYPNSQPPAGALPLLKTADINFNPEGTKRPLVLICVSGGGHSAGAWTLALLHRLEQELRKHDVKFPAHVRLIVGASGGMVGASYYVATLPGPGESDQRDPQEQFRRFTQDALSPVVSQFVYGDLLGILPIQRRYDRGRELEAAWRRNLGVDKQGLGPLDRKFAELHDGEKAGWRPSLIYSPVLVEDGRRLLISNLDLEGVAINRGNCLLSTSELFSREAYEFFRLFPLVEGTPTQQKFALSTAARMSATFPYVSPVVSLPTLPRRRVVDAGYFDNFGDSLAVAWLSENLTWVQEHASGVALIRIRNSVKDDLLRMEASAFAREPRSTPGTRGIEELTTPAEGVLSMRLTGATFQSDERLELLSRHFNDQRLRVLLERLTPAQIRAIATALNPTDPPELHLAGHDLNAKVLDTLRQARDNGTPLFTEEQLEELPRYLDRNLQGLYFSTFTFEFPGEVSLSWYLTRREITQLWQASQNDPVIQERIAALIRWWQRLPRGVPVGQR